MCVWGGAACVKMFSLGNFLHPSAKECNTNYPIIYILKLVCILKYIKIIIISMDSS